MSLLRFRSTLVALLITLLPGCGWFGGGDDGQLRSKGPSLGQVVNKLPELTLPPSQTIKPTRDEVMAAYNRVYGLLPSAAENHAVGKRLADLHMSLGQDKDIAGEETPYLPAVALYEKLLTDNASGEQVDEVLYQLARAHDLVADGGKALHYLNRLIDEYPDSAYVPEARFRRAEIHFSAERYRDATEDYRQVVSLAEQTPYYLNAAYMMGWSEFKRSRFDEGLEQFFNVLDHLLEDGESQELTGPNRELLNDSFRVITLALAYLDGPVTLADNMRRRDKPAWQYLAYERLAQDYFDKERYLDSVATWQAFVEHNSLDARAPAAHEGMVKTLIDAGFPSEVLPKKKEFVVRYGIYSDFWSHHDQQVKEGYLATLHTYLSELAKLAHADAQAFDTLPVKQQKTLDRAALYQQAAGWYEEMIATFPQDPRTAEYLFLLGESYTEAGEHGRAVAAYQRVVRDFIDYERAFEAGYAAILGLTELVGTASADELELWQRLKIDAQIEFALLFPGDERAPAVQTDAANTLFGLGHTSESIDLAVNLLEVWPEVEPDLRKTALLIVGHGRFEQDEYVQAEAAYHQLLAMSLEPDEQDKVSERLLASVYKQGELADAAADVDLAVHHFMRVAQIDPAAALAAQGHFDAIAVIEGAGRIDEAASLLSDFRARYPDHELGKDIDVRLASMYEQTENFAQAAVEYVGLSQSAADAQVRQQSLYRAAELYLQMDNVELAIEHFRDYAHTYKQPQDLRMEAMHHMDELYQRTGEGDKRRFWLNKKIQLHRDMGDQANERATYLAAHAQMVFAEDERARYEGVRLSHPLKRSLKKKQNALKRTLKAYEKVAGYEVAELTTASTYHIANLYVSLSRSIMASDRPQNLSALELEQYEILLEEQAFPFEEQAIGLHELNMHRSWQGIYDQWVQQSFTELQRLMPGRFNKPERELLYASSIH